MGHRQTAETQIRVFTVHLQINMLKFDEKSHLTTLKTKKN